MNTQPWEFTVVTGEVLDKIRQGNLEKLATFAGRHSFMPRLGYQGIYKQRSIDLAIEIFRLMDIAREDIAKRTEWMQRGFRFFDAPAAILISMDRSLEGTWAMFDMGVVAHAICIAALEYGLGTCIEDQGIAFPEVIRECTGIPESKEIVIAVAIGYPDENFPANELRSKREGMANMTTWHGFSE
jgi:nitroreductase